jgi:hypothetical protein
MPRHCEWIQRLDSIQSALHASGDLIDRAAVQSIFQISHRHACRLMQQFGAVPVGGALVISREDLTAKLERAGKEPAAVFERERRERLEDKLAVARREFRARQVVIAAAPEPPPSLRGLPDAIRLQPGELHVHFATPTELLQYLLMLAQAISEDWVDFETRAASDQI